MEEGGEGGGGGEGVGEEEEEERAVPSSQFTLVKKGEWLLLPI